MLKSVLRSPASFKWFLNAYPPLFFTGIWVDEVSNDFQRVQVSMKLHWYNRNLVKTHFGGSLFVMTDPIYMSMLLRILGSDYYIWDRAATIEYIKPGRGKVIAKFLIHDEDIERIKTATAGGEKYFADFNVDIVDEEGQLVSKLKRTLYIRKKK